MARRARVLATLGPASDAPNVMEAIAAAGADGFRLNFSHGTHEQKAAEIAGIRALEEKLGRHFPVMGDLQGPTVRLGDFQPVQVSRGSRVTLTRDGGSGIPVPSDEFFRLVEVGDEVTFEGGRIAARVVERSGGAVAVEALVEGTLAPRKTVAIRGKEYDLPSPTEKDMLDLKFIVEQGLEYVALSFVRSREDVRRLREALSELGSDAWVIAKVETIPGVENVDAVAEESDAVLVARGDLGAKFPLEDMPFIQTRIVDAARAKGKPVIVATQLLDSMMENPIPTRSEVVDVFTAVRDGADAVLLTGETAAGRHPVESVEWASRIVARAEEGYAPRRMAMGDGASVYDAFALGVVELAESMDAKIVAYSRSGNTARRIARHRPRVDTYVFTPDVRTARKISLIWGVIPAGILGATDLEGLANEAVRRGLAEEGDRLVLVRGVQKDTTDMLRVKVL
ncbi:MAG: pyruvate kinase [Conexivisphaera sp.]|jgi:pyruvate kinase|nr:pyruvate kinase [Conexivisphaerales archaeon]